MYMNPPPKNPNVHPAPHDTELQVQHPLLQSTTRGRMRKRGKQDQENRHAAGPDPPQILTRRRS